MAILIAVALIVSLSLYVVPAYLSRQKKIDNSNEFYLAPRPTPPSIFVNASVAYALQMATFGPFFLWGASGDYVPGVVNSLCFGLGILALLPARRAIREFIRHAEQSNRSVTVHAFIASSHGNSRAVRRLASLLTMVALFGIIVAEMLGVTAIVSPFVGGDKDVSFLVAMVLFFLMVLYTALGGNAGVQRSDQFQLGVAYVGLFTLLAGMMLVISDRATLPPHFGTSAAILTLAITAIFAVKRFRIIDATARAIADDELANDPAMLRLARLYRRLETGLNVLAVASMASCLVAVAIAFARSTTMADAASSTRSPVESLPTIAIVSLALLPIAYQLCDISNWQRLGALRPDLSPDNDEEDRKLVRSILRFSVEAPAVWLVLLAFGGIAALYAGTAGGDGTLAAFVSALLAGDDLIGALACSLLLMAILAIALSTMDAVLSAVLLAFREDILFPDPDPPAADEEVQREIELERNRKTNIYAIMFFFVALLLLKLGSQWLVFGEDVYVALLLAFYSAQLAFLPLIVGGVWRGPGAERLKTGPGGALLTLVSGLAASLLLTCLGLAGYGDELGWWAIPGCLGVSALVYLTSCWWPRRQTTVERA